MELYEVSKEIQKAFDLEDEEQKEYLLSQIQLNVVEKSEELLKVCKNQESFNKAIDDEISRLQSLKQARNSKIELIKGIIKLAMENSNLKKIELPQFKLTIAKTPPKVIIENEALVPANFWKTKEVHNIDKIALKEALKKGEVEGAKLESGTALRIK